MKKNSNQMGIFRDFCNDRCIVIWGLRDFKHTHSYIHSNYVRVLRRNSFKVLWFDDVILDQGKVPLNAILICAGPFSLNMPIRNDITYIAHNMNSTQRLMLSELNILFYENFKNESVGDPHKSAKLSLWNSKTKILSQPYGTPVPEYKWLKHNSSQQKSSYENWVGSIWNDSLNRGNKQVISQYIKSLSRLGVKFRQIEFGKLSRLSLAGGMEGMLVAKSTFGASIHSEFQIAEANIVCRFFKSISFGKIPVTNQTFVSTAFPGGALVDTNLDVLLDYRLGMDQTKQMEMFKLAQDYLKPYTYEAAFDRMALAFREDWS